jgi:hypothetical protein
MNIIIFIILLIIISFFILITQYKIFDQFNQKTYDIVYSIIAHENQEYLLKLIENIKKYNKNYNILILFHLNDELYETFKPSINNVLINDIHYNKKTFHHSLTVAHIDNYNYLIKNYINFKYIILLASNCMFIKQMKLIKSPNYTDNLTTCDNNLKRTNHACFDSFNKNKDIMNILTRDKICIYTEQHEGSFYTKKLFGKIAKYIENNHLFSKINEELQFEEIILVSLAKYFNSNNFILYCKVFWNNNNYMVTEFDIDTIRNDQNNHICIVKRVPRDINSNIFKYIDNLPETFKNNCNCSMCKKYITR